LGSTVFGWWGFFFHVLLEKKPFSVGLVDEPFQPASNQVETVEKAWEVTLALNKKHGDSRMIHWK